MNEKTVEIVLLAVIGVVQLLTLTISRRIHERVKSVPPPPPDK